MNKIFSSQEDLPDRTEVAKWISDSGDLQKISGELSQILSVSRFEEWLSSSIVNSIELTEGGKVIGFATLSTTEANLPPAHVEVCHCIVKSDYRRKYNGLNIITSLMREAKKRGFEALVGRVVPGNTAAQMLLECVQWERWNDEQTPSGNFLWYKKELNNG